MVKVEDHRSNYRLEPEPTNSFIAGYKTYQRRVGQAFKLLHEAVFHEKH